MAMCSWIRKMIRLLKGDDGPTAVEYAFILVLILVVALTAIAIFGQVTGDSFQKSSDEIDTALSGESPGESTGGNSDTGSGSDSSADSGDSTDRNSNSGNTNRNRNRNRGNAKSLRRSAG